MGRWAIPSSTEYFLLVLSFNVAPYFQWKKIVFYLIVRESDTDRLIAEGEWSAKYMFTFKIRITEIQEKLEDLQLRHFCAYRLLWLLGYGDLTVFERVPARPQRSTRLNYFSGAVSK